MGAPLYEKLNALAERDPLRLDMPGHHGKSLPWLTGWEKHDFTEHESTGDLFVGGDAIEEAERLWAQRWGAEGCLFLTGGSTQGNLTAMHLCCGSGGTVIADRGSHRSLWNAFALLDGTPVYLNRPWQAEEGILGRAEPEEAERLFRLHPEAKALAVTSPTYYGVISDIAGLAEVCHRHGAKLLVDCAHGAHLPWVGLESPCAQGADLVILSAHKGLPAPGQSAVLLYNGYSPDEVRRAGSVYGSSSPSFAMMSALDRVREYMDAGNGYPRLLSEYLPEFVRRLESETPFTRTVTDDPARLVLSTGKAGCTGHAVLAELERLNVLAEMADSGHLVLILSCMDGREELDRLLDALKTALTRCPKGGGAVPPPPELPVRRVSLRQAMFAPQEQLPLCACEGRISGVQIAPYPPGVPVIAPGEEIEKKHLEYLAEIGYNIVEKTGVLLGKPEREDG